MHYATLLLVFMATFAVVFAQNLSYDPYHYVENNVILARMPNILEEQLAIDRATGYTQLINTTFSRKVYDGFYYKFFNVEADGTQVQVNCTLNAFYALYPLGNGQFSPGAETVVNYADPDDTEDDPYRYPPGITAGDVPKSVRQYLIDEFGSVTNPQSGVDWCGQTIWIAMHGNSVGETQHYQLPGKTGTDLKNDYLNAGCKVSFYQEGYIAQYDLHGVTVSFIRCGQRLYETVEFFLTPQQKRDLGVDYSPYHKIKYGV